MAADRAARLRICATVFLLVLVLGLSGCWNRRELETLGFVSAAGVDIDPATGDVLLTVHVLKPEVLGERAYTEKAFAQFQSKGRTVFEAVRSVIQQAPKRLFWAHNNLLVIGEEAARGGVVRLLDFFIRDGETRRDVFVVVAKGTTANDLLKAEYEIDSLPGTTAYAHIQFARDSLSTSVAVDLNEFLIRLESPGAQPLAVRVELVEKAPADPPGSIMRETIERSPIMGGAAVFVQDRLVGWLEPLETRGMLWLGGDVRSGILAVADPWHADRDIGLELIRSQAKVRFSQDPSGKLMAKVNIDAWCYLGDIEWPIEPLQERDFESAVQGAFEAEIRAEALSALRRLQKEYRSDVLGWGSALHRQLPSLWRQFKERWDDTFPEIEVEVEIRGRVLRSGTNTSILRSK